MAEIANILKTSLNSVDYFMRLNKLPRRTLSEQNKIRFDNKPLSFKIRTKFTHHDIKLKTAGTMLYWSEGFQSEKAHIVDFANCKPDMIAVFVKFLRQICGVDEGKLRVYLYCYSNQNIDEIINFWHKVTKIPKSQFSKPYVRQDFDVAKKGKMPYGLVHIRYADKKLLGLIRQWIRAESFDLIGKVH